ncbi:MAG: hypothetical protein ACOC53_05330 [Candidatus Saliniplasma sp.]
MRNMKSSGKNTKSSTKQQHDLEAGDLVTDRETGAIYQLIEILERERPLAVIKKNLYKSSRSVPLDRLKKI